MLVWLASFPRSGSALTQVILWQCFGISVAKETRGEVAPEFLDFRGPIKFGEGLTKNEIVARAHASDEVVVVKTHGLPSDSAPAIVVVRDGRPVMRSFARFKTEIAGRPTSVRQMIASEQSWSAHVLAWLDHDAPKIVLKYEDLREGKQEALDAIAAFLNMPQIGQFTATVDELRAARPAFVRDARNEPGIEEIERDHHGAFWSRHGKAMRRLGYGP